jgi:sporulation-control protein spo0M
MIETSLIAQGKRRGLDLGLEDDRTRPGGAFRLQLLLECRRSTVLERLTAELRGVRERPGDPDSRQTLLVSEVRQLAGDLTLGPGDRRRFDAEIPVPSDAPCSFRDPQVRIRWSLCIEAAVTDWGTLRDVFDVSVVPRTT